MPAWFLPALLSALLIALAAAGWWMAYGDDPSVAPSTRRLLALLGAEHA